jgi:hypothetical protein
MVESGVCQTWKIMEEARARANAQETNAIMCPLFRFMHREAMQEEKQTIDNNSRKKNGTPFLTLKTTVCLQNLSQIDSPTICKTN